MKRNTNPTATQFNPDMFKGVEARFDGHRVVVLTNLYVVLHGGPADGQTRDLPTRDVKTLGFGTHRKGFHYLDEYARTIELDFRTGRTIFRHRRTQKLDPYGNWFTRFLEWAGLKAVPQVTIGEL